MHAETSKATQIRFNSYLLPDLGALVPGSKNALSPLGLRFDQQGASGELAASGLLDPQGRLKQEFQPILQVLANPSSLVDLRFSSGGYLQQFSLYYSQPDAPPIMLMNTTEGLLLEYPADTKAIINGLIHFSSDSALVSFDFDLTLPYGPALALVALVDLHRRGVARAFADLTSLGTLSFRAPDIANWIAHCPEDPQWFTALMPQQEPGTPPVGKVQEDLNDLVELGICQTARDGFALAGSALALGSRMILIDNLYSMDIARVDASGQVGFVSITALQAGINDLLQIDFLGDEVAFKSLSPIGFILQIEHILAKGGQVVPDPSAAGVNLPSSLQDATVINQRSPVNRNLEQPIVFYCPQCGNMLSETARFCAKCGAIVQL